MNVLERLRGGLVVSVQADPGSPLDAPETIAVLARCAVRSGAVGVRVEGYERVRAVRAAIDAPIVGIVKRRHDGFAPYITSTCEEIRAVVAAGAAVVAFDATGRPRADGSSVADAVAVAHAAGAAAMADCADEADGAAALVAGADALATTLAGYTDATRGRTLPALDLVVEFARRQPFAICEGGVASPALLSAAFAAGAAAVVVGTAITNVDALVRGFAAAVPDRRR